MNLNRTIRRKRKANPYHGTDNSWRTMLSRCLDPKHKSYRYYGALGVKVWPWWETKRGGLGKGKRLFRAELGIRPPGMTLDRIDTTGDYTPGNCQWATRHNQDRNRRTNRYWSYNGERLCVVDWATKLGVDARVLHKRFRLGWPIDKILSTPICKRRRRVSHGSIEST